jgi:hypothetical protein
MLAARQVFEGMPLTATKGFPGSDESFARLHCAGWTVGEVAAHGPGGVVWIVTGSNGENRIEARGRSQAEAWHLALQQAEAVGMARLRPSGKS